MKILDSHLERTSRTFALTIPLLPQPTQRAVAIAYLVFRIADTLEDASAWDTDERVDALQAFSRMLEDEPTADEASVSRRWAQSRPVEHEGYLELLADTPVVLNAFRGLGERRRRIVQQHVRHTIVGMIEFLERTQTAGTGGLETVDELRGYCYAVAGLVGEMLTELFIADHAEVRSVAGALRARSRWFGEGLQLTNILKDADNDKSEGRRYLAPGIPTAHVFAMAREDLQKAEEYTSMLLTAHAPRGLIAFNALPLMLAWATLERVERCGPGAKLTHAEVHALVANMDRALSEGRPAFSRGDARSAVAAQVG